MSEIHPEPTTAHPEVHAEHGPEDTEKKVPEEVPEIAEDEPASDEAAESDE